MWGSKADKALMIKELSAEVVDATKRISGGEVFGVGVGSEGTSGGVGLEGTSSGCVRGGTSGGATSGWVSGIDGLVSGISSGEGGETSGNISAMGADAAGRWGSEMEGEGSMEGFTAGAECMGGSIVQAIRRHINSRDASVGGGAGAAMASQMKLCITNLEFGIAALASDGARANEDEGPP